MRDALHPAIEDAFAREPGEWLSARPPIRPLAAEARVVQTAIRDARARGLTLPDRIVVRFVLAPGQPRGQAERDGATYRITINSALVRDPIVLREVTLHEVAHLSDFCRGLPLSRVEREHRAQTFAAEMMGWR